MIRNFLCNIFNFCVIVSFFNEITSINSLVAIHFLTNASYKLFLITSLFTALLDLLKSIGVFCNLKLEISTFLANLMHRLLLHF